MPGNSSAVHVRQHTNRKVLLFKRRCLAAFVMMCMGSLEAQEEYLIDPPAERQAMTAEELQKTTGRAGDIHYTIRDGLAIAQGDMVLGRVDEQGRLLQRNMGRGLGLNDNFGRWPNGVITYTISDDISDSKRVNIIDAVRQVNELSRISILERTAELAEQYPDNWVNFVDGDACASYVGANAGDTAAQNIWVAPQCTTGSVVHELAHTIGLFHEHTRPDRDQYITVLEQNIQQGSEHNFAIIQAGADDYSTYDYGSIMHYGEYFFSTNPVLKKTIRPPSGQSIGQREKLSEKDIDAINAMYATDLSLSVDVSESAELQEIDISVSNNGVLGAHRIYTRVALPANGRWHSVSRDSGWECLSDDEELFCSRDILEGGELSRFILMAEADLSNSDELIVVVQSRTLDTNLSNNAVNDDGRWASLADNLDNPHGSSDDPRSRGEDVPAIGAGVPQHNGNDLDFSGDTDINGARIADGNAGSASGGGALGGSIVLLGLITGLRRRYPRPPSR